MYLLLTTDDRKTKDEEDHDSFHLASLSRNVEVHSEKFGQARHKACFFTCKSPALYTPELRQRSVSLTSGMARGGEVGVTSGS